MADFRINVIVDPQRARPGIDEVRAELDSLDAAGTRLNENLTGLARDLDIPVDSVTGIATDLTGGFELATEATEALGAANESVVGSVIDTADAVGDVTGAATDLLDKGDGFDDLRARFRAISEEAQSLGGNIDDAGGAANDAVSGLGRSGGVLRGIVLGLGALALAIVAIGLGALVTQDRTREAFSDLGTDILDLGRAVVSGIREMLGPVDDFIVSTVEAASAGVQNLRDDVLRLAGVTDFVTTRQRLYNEAFEDAREASEGFGSSAITQLNALNVSLLNTRESLGLTTGEMIRFNTELSIGDASSAIFDGYSEAIKDLQQDLEDGTIKQFQYNAAVEALDEGLRLNLAAFDESAASARAYAEALIIATEAQQRLDEAFATFNSLASEESVFQKQIDDLVFLRDTGEITMDQFADAVQEALSRISDDSERPFTELEMIAARGAATLQTVFADFLFDPFETGLDGLVLGFANAIRSMTSDALAAMLFESLFGDFQSVEGGPSGLGGIISGIFGSLPGFQNGGEFTVGGSGGTDSQLVAFRASPMENVTITPPGQSPSGEVNVAPPQVNVTNINVTDPKDAVAAMEGSEGDRVFMNFISRKARAINQQLGNR